MSPERRALLETLPGWCWDAIAEQWKRGFIHLKEFADREKHCLIPAKYKAADGYQLGQWVSNLRSTKDILSPERKAKLESVPGWSWDARSEMWEEGYRYLKEFALREGHCLLPALYRAEDGYRIGSWVNTQRSTKDSLSPERKARLESLPGWIWDAISGKWEEGFNCLKKFTDREGHAKVASNFKTADGYRLGQWVSNQRATKDITPERKVLLETLPGWVWDAIVNQWQCGFLHLKEFVEREGHAKVNKDFKAADGYRLGQWVSNQRATKERLSPEIRVQLEALSVWSWEPFSEMWEEGYYHLKEFVDQEGHAKAPKGYKMADGYRVGGWVSVQRRVKEKLSLERKARLEALSGWSWDSFSDKWEEGFSCLKEFRDRIGHARPPHSYKSADGYRLGIWVGTQRANKDNISLERKVRLEALLGWSWDPLSDMWEEGFSYLKEFSDREGHAKVSHSYKTADRYMLGYWVATQRSKKDSLSPEYKARLETLPGWVWRVK